ncbi:MAG TPA: S9 family peptidase [Gemmatimonadales bacterium]|nr:S9 family peptidase [Gemmatimonadales bacterium]
MTRMLWPCAALAALALAGGARPALAQRRPATEQDLLRIRWVADPQISPDGRQVAYVLVTANEKEDRYDASVWVVGTDGAAPRRLTVGPRDAAPRWSPAGDALAFLRAGEKEPAQLWILPLGAGEPRRLTKLAKGAGPAVWSPDGRSIAFTSVTLPGDSAADSTQKPSDVRIITRAEYRLDGDGWRDPERRRHIWRVEVDLGREGPAPARQLTTGPFDEDDVEWSPDGARIYFTSDRVLEPYYAAPDANLYAVPADGGALDTVVDIAGPIGGAVPSPDGRTIAFVGFRNPPRIQSSTEPELFVTRDGRAVSLTDDYDFDVGDQIITDQRPPRGGAGSSPLLWLPDGSGLVSVTTEHGGSRLIRFDAMTGRREVLLGGDREIAAYTASRDGARFALTLSDPTHPLEVHLLETATRRLTRLTAHNDSLLAQVELAAPEELWYPSFDGRRIHAWVYRPAGFAADRTRPLILDIHGGPHLAYGWSFFHEFQLMAARGYVVLAPNPRGSTTYGQEFANIIQYRYPGDDYRDLMIGVDTLIRRGYADPRRLGVTGGSGGGLLTNWVIGQTDRFAAAVAQRSIGDWGAFWYTADFSQFTPFWFRSTPFRDPEEFRARSPVRYVERINTPLMLIEGEADLRTPPAQGGEVMFRALKALRKPVVMVTFPGEPHGLSRMGRPSHRIARLQHILNWFDKYLQGKEIDLYQVQ